MESTGQVVLFHGESRNSVGMTRLASTGRSVLWGRHICFTKVDVVRGYCFVTGHLL